MLNLKFLGRGSSFNLKEGNTSAFIKENKTLLLIDCGETIFKTIQEKNLLDDVKKVYILITHLHSDHVGSLSSLLMYCWYVKKIQAKIFYPDKELIKTFLEFQGNRFNQTYTFFDINNFEFPDIPELNIGRINYVETPHDKIVKKTECRVDGELTSYKSKTLFTTYSYEIIFSMTEPVRCSGLGYIFYSGDSSIINEEALYTLEKFITGESEYLDVKIYQDTSLKDYKGNIHTSLNQLKTKTPYPLRKNIYCMHLDCEELIDKAIIYGFNVVDVI